MCNLSQRQGFLLLASNLFRLNSSSEIASYVGKVTFRLSVAEAKSRSKNCLYKVKNEKLKEEKYQMNRSIK